MCFRHGIRSPQQVAVEQGYKGLADFSSPGSRLCDLQVTCLDHTLFFMSDERLIDAVRELSCVMARLRRECPWDRRQTHRSLRRYLLEECHEVLDALDRGHLDDLKGELGDLLFQIWFHAEVAAEGDEERGIAAICEDVTAKLVRRHPHVFEGEVARGIDSIQKNWEATKAAEGRESRLDGVPPLMPALLGSQCLQEKAASVGFDWTEVSDVLDKVHEEVDELHAELGESGSHERREHELGDLLFSLVNYGRHIGVNAEDAVRAANRRFTSRFQFIERAALASNRSIDELSLDEMEALWQKAKS